MARTRQRVAFVLLLSVHPSSVSGHGALMTPTTRRGGTGYENDPVPSNVADAFVCRHAAPNANVPLKSVTAGATLELTWDFSAAHVGDCA
eukprot:5081728-Prymnesium_polylepis.1